MQLFLFDVRGTYLLSGVSGGGEKVPFGAWCVLLTLLNPPLGILILSPAPPLNNINALK